jgi:hypothetical protein
MAILLDIRETTSTGGQLNSRQAKTYPRIDEGAIEILSGNFNIHPPVNGSSFTKVVCSFVVSGGVAT